MLRKIWALLTGGTCVELYDSITEDAIKSIAYRKRRYKPDFSYETHLVASVFWGCGVGTVWLLPDGDVDGPRFITRWRKG